MPAILPTLPDERYPALRQARLAAIAAIILLAFTILVLDRPVSTWSHDVLHRPVWCIWLTHISDLPQPASVLGLGLAGIAWLYGWRPGVVGRVLLAACIATLAAESAKDVLKLAFSRPWPETWINHNPSWIDTKTFGFFPFHGGAGWASFPSGHVVAVSAPCTVLWRGTAWPTWLWTLPSVVVTLALIACDYHFLGDCLAGAMVGVACGLAVHELIARGR